MQISIGDQVFGHNFQSNIRSTKDRLQTLSSELTSGFTSDVGRKESGSISVVSALQNSNRIANSYIAATKSVQAVLDNAQNSIENIDSIRQEATQLAFSIDLTNNSQERKKIGDEAFKLLESTVNSLNTTFTGRYQFSGAETQSPALLPAKEIISLLASTLNGVTDPETIQATIDQWFDDPAGGFHNLAYLGSSDANRQVSVGIDDKIELNFRANNVEVVSILKSLASMSLVSESITSIEADAEVLLIENAGKNLFSDGAAIASLMGRLGFAQQYAENAELRLTTESDALTQEYTSKLSVDPYETATNLQAAQNTLELQFQVTARLSSLSLANYI